MDQELARQAEAIEAADKQRRAQSNPHSDPIFADRSAPPSYDFAVNDKARNNSPEKY